MFSKFVLILTLSTSALASYESAENNYNRGSAKLAGHRKLIIELVKDDFYFSAIPWMKELLVNNSKMLDSDLEEAFDKMVNVTGVKPFESLPVEILKYSRS